MSTPPTPAPAPPSWPYCAHGADPATNPVGCRGIHVPGHTQCLAHLNDSGRDAYLASLAPGTDIDHRSTPFTEPLLRALLQALYDPTTERSHFGDAWFGGAHFSGHVDFDDAQFSGPARFGRARFSGDAEFGGTRFSGDAEFSEAQFSGATGFSGTQFSGRAGFSGTQFSGAAEFGAARFSGAAEFGAAQFSNHAHFIGARFSGRAWFVGAQFSSTARFDRAQISGDARFDSAQFVSMSQFGPMACGGRVDVSGAVFEVPVTLEIAAREVRCERTRWESTATL